MFTGRLDRLSYLLGIVYTILPLIVMMVVFAITQSITSASAPAPTDPDLFTETSPAQTGMNSLIFLFGAIWTLLIIPVSFGLAARRLHDMNQSGWLTLLTFVPVVNWAAILLFFIPGTPGPNQYGQPNANRSFKAILFGKQ